MGGESAIKFIKITLLVFIIFILSGLLFSPIVSLFLPEKLTNHTYYRLCYHVIVDKETKGCLNNEEKVSKLFNYVVNHEFGQGTPFKCKPLESLIYAEAYCDFQARTLNALLGIVGIPSRYAMLSGENDISIHTVNEVFLRDKWCIFGPLMNIIYRDKEGNFLSLDQLFSDPGLVYIQRKFMAMKEYNKIDYENCTQQYFNLFSLYRQTKRSTPRINQYHILDYINDGYFKIFGYVFFNPYQDIYLKFKKNYGGQEDFKLFFIARNYQLTYRNRLALINFGLLLDLYPESKYREDAIFFCAKLYADTGNFSKAIRYLKYVTEGCSLKWRQAAYFYLGEVYQQMGNKETSLFVYKKANVQKLSAEVLEALVKHKTAE